MWQGFGTCGRVWGQVAGVVTCSSGWGNVTRARGIW